MPLADWFAEYGGAEFKLPDIAGKYEGRNLIICADGRCVWEDLENFGCKSNHHRGKVRPPDSDWDFMVVNKLGEVFPGNIQHWYSNEPHLLKNFCEGRRAEYGKEFENQWKTHSCNRGYAKYHWPWKGHGTSGLNAILTGIGLGYERIVLCGMPLDDSGHNGEPHWRRTNFTREVSDTADGQMCRHWLRAKTLAFDGKVRSMSGRTAKWLGTP